MRVHKEIALRVYNVVGSTILYRPEQKVASDDPKMPLTGALFSDVVDGKLAPVALLLIVRFLEDSQSSRNDPVDNFGALEKSKMLMVELGPELVQEERFAAARNTIETNNNGLGAVGGCHLSLWCAVKRSELVQSVITLQG
ncbi:hypothetical protein CH063_14312 [Colletotrichum higginsianum]|uniref:Uncharacterized protein n=1 Tax=Colletotrichum higginsianum (strain IMI 349063) TaxID=759273 RepID=H1VY11_COLHI|nr:hypothetical protein CH063_14312 [Colletotrichum higginsianum]